MKRLAFAFTLASLFAGAHASKLVEVRPIDEEYVMLRFQDGWVTYNEKTSGPQMFGNPEGVGGDILETFGKPLDADAATVNAAYAMTSKDDSFYEIVAHPLKVSRKSKVSGTAWKLPDPDFTLEHTLYLKMPRTMHQGKHYHLDIASQTNSDKTSVDFEFDIYNQVSEAVHTNIIGYDSGQKVMKSADLYLWLGDGGFRNYSSFEGRKVYLTNTATKSSVEMGNVTFWKESGPDVGGWNLIQSNVWNCDFSSFSTPGTYRLVVEGVGCSQDFVLGPQVYFAPYAASVRGLYFMRVGEDKTFSPVPRQPRYIPKVDPPQFQVYLTTMSPVHPEWKSLGTDPWDNKDWSKYCEPGNPTNPQAFGGHSDAADWDRHAGHISIIWDLLLPYLLTNGRLSEDNLGIKESGNGIPDVLDEARNEVDFWLRLRDAKGGYSFGISNPTEDGSAAYQAAAHPYMAWASAANAAMLANCFKIAGKAELVTQYTKKALEAWNIAKDQDLDFTYSIGNGSVRSRDLKLMAAAYLYNVTGDRTWEKVVTRESVVMGPNSPVEVTDKSNQLYGTAAYVLCQKFAWQPVHFPALAADMRDALIHQTLSRNVGPSKSRPSRRSTTDAYGWFQTCQEVQMVCVAHAVAQDDRTKADMLRALILEADYGLGRNPLNATQMTGLGARHPEDIYSSGRMDGIPESHPGQTPYMNAEPWTAGTFMGDPQWMASRGYPAWKQWPVGEALWRARYCYANNEFTPQQTMRGKMCLLAYLYGIR